MFSVNGFNLKDDDYYAVYPYLRPVYDPSCINFFLAGQNRDANDDASGLSAYDLNLASTSVCSNRGNFHFKHKVAWLKLFILTGKAATYKEVIVSADEGIANTIQLNAIRGDVSAVPVSADEKITLTLNNGNGIKVAEHEVFYGLTGKKNVFEPYCIRSLCIGIFSYFLREALAEMNNRTVFSRRGPQMPNRTNVSNVMTK